MFWGCFGYVRASHPTKNYQNKTPGVFFMLNSILELPDLEIPLKIKKNKQKPTFKKIEFSKIDEKMIWTYEYA